MGGPAWPDGTTTSWIVSQNANLSWNYDYTLEVSGQAVSHLIIEVSPEFTVEDVMNFDGPGAWDVDFWEANPGNPSIPEGLQGFKLTPGGDLTLVQFSFDSWRDPVWGDFYSKCGGQPPDVNVAYNLGFTSPDTDPVGPPSNGSLNNHLLVPDTHTTVPEPTSLALSLLAMGAGLGGAIRRRRAKKN